MAVSLRFHVSQITRFAGVNGNAQVKLTPSYAQGKNAEWASATPSGAIELNVGNPEAIEKFETWLDAGTDLHITMEPVPRDE